MNPAVMAIGGIVEGIGKVADDLFTSDEERAAADLELKKLGLEAVRIDAGLMTGQMEVNKAEAAHSSIFVAGWRPAVGWTGVAAMAYQFVLYPFLVWGWALMQAKGWIPAGLTAPPMLDTDALWVILSGILGIGTMRSVEKVKGKA